MVSRISSIFNGLPEKLPNTTQKVTAVTAFGSEQFAAQIQFFSLSILPKTVQNKHFN